LQYSRYLPKFGADEKTSAARQRGDDPARTALKFCFPIKFTHWFTACASFFTGRASIGTTVLSRENRFTFAARLFGELPENRERISEGATRRFSYRPTEEKGSGNE
jgi:hypothetical protein